MKHTAPLFEDIVVAVLSVNSFGLDKAFRLREALRTHGCFDAEQMAKWSHDDAVAALVTSGYNRGATMNSIFASRLQELGMFIKAHGLIPLSGAIAAGDTAQATVWLQQIHGIGPAVIRNFWILQAED